MATPYKMKGHALPGIKQKISDSEKRSNLLKAVPNEEAYNKLSDTDKKGFDAAGKKAGLPQKKAPTKFAPFIPLAISAVSALSKAKRKNEEE